MQLYWMSEKVQNNQVQHVSLHEIDIQPQLLAKNVLIRALRTAF